MTRPGGGQCSVIPTPRCRRCHDEREQHEPRVRATGSDGRFSSLQDRTVTYEPPGGCSFTPAGRWFWTFCNSAAQIA